MARSSAAGSMAVLMVTCLSACSDGVSPEPEPDPPYDLTTVAAADAQLTLVELNDAGMALYLAPAPILWDQGSVSPIPLDIVVDLGPDGSVLGATAADSVTLWNEGSTQTIALGAPIGIAEQTGELYYRVQSPDGTYAWKDDSGHRVLDRYTEVVGEDATLYGGGFGGCWAYRDGVTLEISAGSDICRPLVAGGNRWLLYSARNGGYWTNAWHDGEVYPLPRGSEVYYVPMPTSDINDDGWVLGLDRLVHAPTGEEIVLSELGVVPEDWVLYLDGRINGSGQLALLMGSEAGDRHAIFLLTPTSQ